MAGIEHERPGHARRGFVLVGCGPFSGINDSLFPLLERAFPELEPARFDVPTWVRSERRVFAANLAWLLAEYGPPALIGRAHPRKSFYQTSYIFSRIRRAMRDRVAASPHAFTFQTQSMFDASVPGVPHFVYTDHTALANTYYPGFDPKKLPTKRRLARETQIYERAALNFTMSRHVSRSLVELYGIAPDRVRCVFAGSNVDPGAAGPAPDGKQLLFVGRDWERKGGRELIAAFAKVRERHPDARLVIAGCSPNVQADGVTVLGEVGQAALNERYSRSRVFCMPTRVEPFGLVFVEALAHGLPVVATSIGALPDIVQDGETGFLVEPDDTTKLAEAVSLLLADPERSRRFGELGRQRVAERYTWPRVADSIAAQIRETIAIP